MIKRFLKLSYIFLLCWTIALVVLVPFIMSSSSGDSIILSLIDKAVPRLVVYANMIPQEVDTPKRLLLGFLTDDGRYYIYNYEVTWETFSEALAKSKAGSVKGVMQSPNVMRALLLSSPQFDPPTCFKLTTCEAYTEYNVVPRDSL